ncbi:MAG: hypothetical protein Kow0069_01340 [Promethearchaeota archaeon]
MRDLFECEFLDDSNAYHPVLGELTRVRVLGTVVEVTSQDSTAETFQLGDFEEEGLTFTEFNQTPSHCLLLDDGTGVVPVVKSSPFSPPVQVGNMVDVMGTLSNEGGQLVVQLEILTIVQDMNFEILRELDLLKRKRALASGGAQRGEVTPKGARESESLKQQILSILREQTNEEGVQFEELLQLTGVTESRLKEALTDLLTETQIYEPTRGRYSPL